MLNFYSTFAVLTDKMKKKKNLFVFFAYSLPLCEGVLVIHAFKGKQLFLITF